MYGSEYGLVKIGAHAVALCLKNYISLFRRVFFMCDVITDVFEKRSRSKWMDSVVYKPNIVGGNGFVSDVLAAFQLLLFHRKYQVAVLCSNRKSSIFALFKILFALKIRILMIDCLWYMPKNWWKRFFKMIQFIILTKAVDKFVVWSSHEISDYSNAFNIDSNKFVFIPHHHTLEGYAYTLSHGDYIFAGGDGDRDYGTLLDALTGIDIQVIVATRRKDWNDGHPVPRRVEAYPTTHEEFRVLMAGSKMVVIPMRAGLLHSGGQQTYLNAMAMGKPVIVADRGGALDYIQDGVNGLLVPAGDVQSLRSAIQSILKDPGYAAKLSRNAEMAESEFSTARCMERILAIACDLGKHL